MQKKRMADHSIFSPSSAHRWTKCPGSIKLSLKMPVKETHPSAIVGTDAHFLAEKCLKTGLSAQFFLGCELPSGQILAKNMCEKVQGFVDYVNHTKTKSPGTLHVERRIYLKEIDERAFGTSDAILISPKEKDITIHVFDLKYGKWPVDPSGNEQMMYYALGAIEMCQNSITVPPKVFGHIYQPNSKDGKVEKMAEYKWMDLMDFKLKLDSAIKDHEAHTDERPKLLEGDHCQFCPAELICPTLNSFGRKIN